MGCDIYTVVQRCAAEGWETVSPPTDMLDEYGEAPYEIRNYTLFGVLAGVREHDVDPIAEPRGLPPDAEVGEDECGDPAIDGKCLGEHSHSWLTAAEIAAYDWSQPSPYPPGTIGEDVSIDSWLPWLLSLADDPKGVRLVFGFDS